MATNPSTTCSQELLPILAHALPSIISYTLPSEKVVQGNAEGARILARHNSSTLSEKFEGTGVAVDQPGKGGDAQHDSRLLVTAQDGEHNNPNDSDSIIEETELFIKRVMASSYTHKTWTDMRRTLVYIRTEVRFYNEIVPLLLEAEGSDSGILQKYLPIVHHADYNLNGLVAEDSPSTDAKQPSPFPTNDSDDATNECKKNELLKEKGGHILLQSLSPSHGYFQDSPISIKQSLSCLTAVAELHASAWGNVPLLQTISDRLSSAGGSYQLQFRNPKELQDMVASWEYFRGQFVSVDNAEAKEMLEKESVVRLGQRIFDMAEYVSKELSPSVEDEYATLVHGDYKAMNVFLPNDENDDNKSAIMIDFSCTGIGYGMSDVAMHIVHAILPADLDNNDGEEQLVEGYLVALEHAMNRKLQQLDRNNHATNEQWTYPREAAMRHYQLACIDYLRFIMGRFWRSATPDSFEKKKASKNTTLINRNLDSALRFIDKVDGYLKVFEKEKRERVGR